MKLIQKCFSQLTDPSPRSSSGDVGQHDGDEDGEHDQDRMIQQTLKAPPETEDICYYFLSVDLFFSEMDFAAMLFSRISFTI